MPKKLTLKEVKEKLPPFVIIKEQTYTKSREKAVFIDTEYNEEFIAIVHTVIQLQHGCKTRSNKLRGEFHKGKHREKISIEEIKTKLPEYLELIESSYKSFNVKAQFYDKGYDTYFEACPCNVLRNGKGGCPQRIKDEAGKVFLIPTSEIKEQIKELYGERIILIEESYIDKGTICSWLFDGNKICKTPDSLLKGRFIKNHEKSLEIAKRKEAGKLAKSLKPPTYKREKHSLEYIKKVFEDNGCELLQDYYISAKSPIYFKCSCGQESDCSSFMHFRETGKCKNCSRKIAANKLAFSYEEVVEKLSIKNYKLLMSKEEYNIYRENRFNKKHSKLKIECSEGHIKYYNYDIVSAKNGCRQCFYKRNSGSNNNRYIHGNSKNPELNRRFCKQVHDDWRNSILKRDKWACVICGHKSVLRAHHLNGYNWDIQNRWSIDNGVTLCEMHHNNFHQVYGRERNIRRQFEEYESIIKSNMDFLEGRIDVPLLLLPNKRSFSPGNYLLN